MLAFQIVLLSLSMLVSDVSGHGYLIEPPSRASAWRFGFGTPANYNDMESNCGGQQVYTRA